MQRECSIVCQILGASSGRGCLGGITLSPRSKAGEGRFSVCRESLVPGFRAFKAARKDGISSFAAVQSTCVTAPKPRKEQAKMREALRLLSTVPRAELGHGVPVPWHPQSRTTVLCWGILRVDNLIPLALPWAGFGPKSLKSILLLMMLPAERAGIDSPAEKGKNGVNSSGNSLSVSRLTSVLIMK